MIFTRILPRASTSSPFFVSVKTSRLFSTSITKDQKLRIGYVPEHFLTPLHFAKDHFGLDQHAELLPFPRGTGSMIDAFETKDIDVGIGLTEGWVVGLTKTFGGNDWSDKPYHMVGAYTMSPLTWAISTGAMREDITYVEELKGAKVGISRFGSGSHVMASVLAQTHGWSSGMTSKSLEFIECGPFQPLREAVKNGKADFFMWEHFTTKKFWDNHELKRLGEIETPWPAWHIAAAGAYADERIAHYLLPALQKGVKHFQTQPAEAIKFITETMEYSEEDAKAWYGGVRFASRKQMGVVDDVMMTNALAILQKTDVIGDRRIMDHKALQAVDAERYMLSESEEYESESAAPFRG